MIAGLFKKLLKRLDPKAAGSGLVLAAHFIGTLKNSVPLGAKEQDELDRLLRAALPNKRVGCVTSVDGFFTCLAVGAYIGPEEWLGFLFSETHFIDDEQTRHLLTLLERRRHHVAADFARTKPRFQPLIADFTQAKTAKPIGRHVGIMEVWCSGFMAGTELRFRAWNKLLDVDNAFSPLSLLWVSALPTI